jgi:cyclopropane-fatty-acyl-phospholipid synthase
MQMTSPDMVKWFEGLGVETERSDMSFSVSTLLDNDSNAGGFEWGSRNGISGLLAQKRNWLSPSFWRMILEIFKFKNHAIK